MKNNCGDLPWSTTKKYIMISAWAHSIQTAAWWRGTVAMLVGWLCWCFKALHFSGHFGRGQLTHPHCSWASLLDILQVLGAHSFAGSWQLPFLNQQTGENGHRNDFMTNLYERMLPDVRIESATVRIPSGCGSDRATSPAVPMSPVYLTSLVVRWWKSGVNRGKMKCYVVYLNLFLHQLIHFLERRLSNVSTK